ncbi:hypothetical protein SAMN05192553_103540 [Cyclobacterium xiamenense]|uniref:Uncharacterized protein n=1 Tax=Cyclobacterium xiamenense TaxID=1297121 RepID=A0A1H6YCA1_9BACT|nr:hypothetical protein SAMN05192553_103540 [Cyclobacterium xiamenense]
MFFDPWLPVLCLLKQAAYDDYGEDVPNSKIQRTGPQVYFVSCSSALE